MEDRDRDRDRAERWWWINVAAAAAIFVLLAFFVDIGLYLTFVQLDWLGAMGFFVAVPLLAWWIYTNRNRDGVRLVWATFAAVVLLGLGTAAIMDANRFQYHNCWRLNEQNRDSARFVTWECVPKSEPVQGEWFSEERGDGSYASCEHIDTSSSGGTIWRCEYGDL